MREGNETAQMLLPAAAEHVDCDVYASLCLVQFVSYRSSKHLIMVLATNLLKCLNRCICLIRWKKEQLTIEGTQGVVSQRLYTGIVIEFDFHGQVSDCAENHCTDPVMVILTSNGNLSFII